MPTLLKTGDIMVIKLKKTPKNPTIIEGFPGFGLVGTIATEFLIDHLKTEMIGSILLEDLPAMAAVHKEKLVQPIGIFYNQDYNIVIFHVITAVTGLEWKVAEKIIEVADQMKAREIVSLEGIGSSADNDNPQVFFYTPHEKKREELIKDGLKPLKEGIIMGVTSTLLLKSDVPVTCIFSETHSSLPDSKAAAEVIKILDKYLKLKVDPKPLLATAEEFEGQLKGILTKSQEAQAEAERKKLSYVG